MIQLQKFLILFVVMSLLSDRHQSGVVVAAESAPINFATADDPSTLNNAEEDLIMREMEWAEKTMEAYKRKSGNFPLRSTIKAPHVHTAEWKQDSIDSAFSDVQQLISDNNKENNSNKRNLRSR